MHGRFFRDGEVREESTTSLITTLADLESEPPTTEVSFDTEATEPSSSEAPAETEATEPTEPTTETTTPPEEIVEDFTTEFFTTKNTTDLDDESGN